MINASRVKPRDLCSQQFSLGNTFPGNDIGRVEVCEPPLQAEQFRAGHRGGITEVSFSHARLALQGVSGSCRSPGAQENRGPLEWLEPKLSLSLAFGTTTSTKGLLIHTRLLSLAKESSLINPFSATCVSVHSLPSSQCDGHRSNPALSRHHFLRLQVSCVIFKMLQVFEEHIEVCWAHFHGFIQPSAENMVELHVAHSWEWDVNGTEAKKSWGTPEPSDPSLKSWFG